MFANVGATACQVTELAGGNRNSYSLGCKTMSERTGIRPLSLLLLGAVFFFSPVSRAQTSPEETPGINSGNYNVQETVELGYRKDWITGNGDTFDTFVGFNTGLRLLDYTMNMRSLNHQGILFDNLAFSNFGYGGDPDNVSRLRVEKNKTYDFSAVFRRHKNFWDYNLLANPLNPVPFTPSLTTPSFASTQSPHSLFRVRRMQDYDLTLFPQSAVRLRLGFSHDADQGPSLTTLHGTTDFLLAQNFRMTTNAYRMGVDFRVLPKTTISYDQFLEWDKQDTSDTLANTPFQVSTSQFPGTMPVDLGLDYYYPPAATTVPCAAPFPSGYPGYANNATTTTGLTTATVGCKMYQSYSRTAPTRNFMPTERLSFQSTYIPRVEMSGSASYSSSHNVVSNLYDSANEWTASTTSQVRDVIVSGPAAAKQIFAHANWSAIVSLTQKVRIVDSVSFDQWQNPGNNNLATTSLFATAAQATGQTGILLPIASFAPLVTGGPTFASICPSPYTALTCPQHQSYTAASGALAASSSATADVSLAANANYLGQRLFSNTIQLQADFTKRISGRIGYMYENRNVGEIDANSIPAYSIYYPGGAGGTVANDHWAARGSCANYNSTTGVFSPTSGTCTQNADGSVTYTNPLSASVPRLLSTINEQVALAGLTLRPMDTLRINADFEFGYNDYSYTRIWPRQIQSYKVHVNYRPRTWATIDGAVDIHENRDNVSQVNNLEHGRTYGLSMVLAPNPKFAYTLGLNYTNIYLQTYICFVDTFGGSTGLTGPAVPTFPACTISNSPAAQGATEFYADKQYYAYSDVMWKPVNRVTATVGYNGTFAGGSERGGTLFLDPLQPAGTIAFNYQKPFASIQIDIYKGLSYKTTWNYYGYNSKTPFNTSIPVTNANAPNGLYSLQPIGAPDFNGSTLMFAIRYAF